MIFISLPAFFIGRAPLEPLHKAHAEQYTLNRPSATDIYFRDPISTLRFVLTTLVRDIVNLMNKPSDQ
jgi:hypothetical protein